MTDPTLRATATELSQPPGTPIITGPDAPIHHVIASMRAMRRLSPEPVPRDVIERIVRAATWAPSASDGQHYSFVAVTDRRIMGELAVLWRLVADTYQALAGDPTAPQTATVSTWGRMDCPEGMYPAGNASICSAVTNIVMLQEWVPRPSNPKYGTWRNIGEVLIVEKLAEGRWPYRCATLACKTPLPDYVGFQMRPVPGSATPTVIPTGFPAYTDWTRVTYGSVDHK